MSRTDFTDFTDLTQMILL